MCPYSSKSKRTPMPSNSLCARKPVGKLKIIKAKAKARVTMEAVHMKAS